MTKELEKKMPTYEEIEDVKYDDLKVLVHYFNPAGRGNWFGVSYDPETRIMFGYVSIFGDWNDEAGDFSLQELEELKLPLGLSIERNLHWTPKSLKEVRDEYTRA